MNKEYKNSLILSKFTPDAIEIGAIMKKYPNQTPAPKLIKYENGCVFEKENCKQSKIFTFAYDFESGYAFVYDHGDYHYIDTDFVTVLYEPKINSVMDLAKLISINPKGVKKYVSPAKILSLRDSTAYEFLTDSNIKNEKCLSKALSTIQKFVKKNKIEQTV